MRFDRLRLNGFKSFVDPTELVISDGLTGVVGPNGCGKSNLLEALRWVMGENRPSAMRGDGMEDVIFAGTTRRPARGHAEVVLTVDNRARLAPAGFNDTDVLEISRRIVRDAGSAYRVNGREVRARDVQMLFADASTGAHSPALVRQGQISELINARPKARRRILEEAAGISGLYQRRHEAELKLNGAEANLTRVDDTLQQLAAQAAALTRQARAAARYREIGTLLRHVESALLYHRWAQADRARNDAAAALDRAGAQVARAEAAARQAAATCTAAETALPPLREEEAIAAAILARAQAEREALDDAEARAAQAVTTLRARVVQLDRDIEREAALNRDATEVVQRLDRERDELETAGLGHEDRVAAAEAAAASAADALRDIEVQLAELTDEAARLAARHQSADRLVTDLESMLRRAEAAAAAATATADRASAQGRAAEAALTGAEAARTTAGENARAAEETLAAAETARTAAETEETSTRAARAAAEGEAGTLDAERHALTRLVARGRTAGPRLLDLVTVAPGFEAAFGAALGDDLAAPPAPDPGASGWRDLPAYAAAPELPAGAAPLGDHVTGPAMLARRLEQTGLVPDAATGAALQPALHPGQRLVTRQGDLFRWDGLTVPAGDAVSTAALHLQQVNRLADLAHRADAARQRADQAAAAHSATKNRLAEAARAEADARDRHRAAERALAEHSRAATRAESDLSLATGQIEAARAELTRHAADAADARTRLDAAQRSRAELPDPEATTRALTDAREAAQAARADTVARRATLDQLTRDDTSRARRLQEIAREHAGWRTRLDQADRRTAELQDRHRAAVAELTAAQDQPARLAARRAEIAAREDAAQQRLDRARAALAKAGAALLQATGHAREAERAASAAREERAACAARAEAAQAAEAAALARITAETGAGPRELESRLDATADPAPDLAELESRLLRLRSQRDAIGPVNLRADEDKRALEDERTTLLAENDDLTAAIHKLRAAIGSLNREGRQRILSAFDAVNASFGTLFTHLFGGGEARLVMVESDDPLDAGLEILCQPPGKKLATLSLLSGGEQTLTALALIFAVFLANPAPICVLDEVDAPLDDANVGRFCDLLDEMTRRTDTRFLIITHHAVTMGRMDRLFGVTMGEQGVSQMVSVDLRRAEALVA
ncbi:AAA family ATPase [uncultured Paracoccus sp.]|uniref:chromosome segregation SMC family protein n=1 Tax=uncultured Paracoccus sp. TaxID=189685 RepID=UPI0026042321|nr:AAA family ATPase [uncultured Paracoccus sp.]